MNENNNAFWAQDIYPDSCSCGIDYESEGETYKKHLEKCHVIETEVMKN